VGVKGFAPGEGDGVSPAHASDSLNQAHGTITFAPYNRAAVEKVKGGDAVTIASRRLLPQHHNAVPFTKLKIAALAPIPRTTGRSAMIVKPGIGEANS
jgi:hypothetical protein